MASNNQDDENGSLYLHHISIETPNNTGYRVKLSVDGADIQLTPNTETFMWTPPRSLEVSESSKVKVTLKTGHTIAGVSFKKEELSIDVDVQDAIQRFLLTLPSEILVSENVLFRQNAAKITVSFRPPPTSDSVRSTLQSLQKAVNEFRHIMDDSTQKHLDTVVKFGVAFSELDPRSKTAFSVLAVTFGLLKEQKQRDQSVSGLAGQLKRVLPFADKALKEAIEGNADILRQAIGRLYTLTIDVADFTYAYIKRNRFRRLAKSLVSAQDQERITGFTSSFSDLVEDFDRAVNVETLKTVRNMEYKMLLDRLQPVQTGYDLDRCCMKDTRAVFLDEIIKWALRPCSAEKKGDSSDSNVYWIYGIPGVGKTAVAHSICARLHKEGQLGGSFFCRRDDQTLSDPKSIVPTLIYDLSESWVAYRKLVAEKLRGDPKLTRKSVDYMLFPELLGSLQNHPPHPLIVVIDALDECGDRQGRSSVLASLFSASSRVDWLRIVVTSRQDHDIESSFERFRGRYLAKDLKSADDSRMDIHLFARNKLAIIADQYSLSEGWPGIGKLEEIVERAKGLFIFVETLYRLLLEAGLDIDECLTQALSVGSGTALDRLYNLYETAIRSQIGDSKEKFRSAMGSVIAVGEYQPLPDEAIAQLSGLQTNIVTILVNKLGSLLYRDTTAKNGIRVRHLSVIEFLTKSTTHQDLRVEMEEANRRVGIACLRVMIRELRFNICELETSFVSNAEVADLKNRVDRNMSTALQYSCVYWSNHLCNTSDLESHDILPPLGDFSGGLRLLYWMEALSVMDKVSAGESALRKIRSWLKSSQASIAQRLDDALRFLFTFRGVIVTSAPHIYLSGLPFTPTDTDLWREGRMAFKNLLVVREGRTKKWPSRPNTLTGHSGGISCMAYSPDGLYIVSGSSDNTIRKWDAETGDAVGEPLRGHTSGVTSVAYSPDGRRIISGSYDKTIRMWDAETGDAVGEPLRGHTYRVTSVAYSPDGRRIISGSIDQTIRMWDGETGDAVGEPLRGHTNLVRSVAYSPDGRRIISGSYDETIRMWDGETGDAVGEPLRGHISSVTSVAYSPDGRRIISGSNDETIRMWDGETGDAVGEPLRGHTSYVMSVAYSPDGRRIISGSGDQTIRTWDAETGDAVGGPLRGHTDLVTSVAYSPDGRRIISGSYDKTIRMWDAETGDAVGEPLRGHTYRVTSVAYSPDGRRIISGSDDRTIRMWDAETGDAVGGPLQGHTSYVMSVAYSPDGCRIISGSSDQSIQMWGPTVVSATFQPDSNGWVRHSDGSPLFWVPEDSRNGLSSPAILTIPSIGRHRVVRVDISRCSFGESWTDIKTADD